jgi:hypothetical protein
LLDLLDHSQLLVRCHARPGSVRRDVRAK